MSLSVDWKGTPYPLPPFEPPQDRDPAGLHPIFRAQVEAFVREAQPHLRPDLLLRIGECRRSLERQTWLYAQGRVNGERVRSWTMDSKHRYGLAADLILVDLGENLESSADDTADWSPELWREMYAAVPPELFGVSTIPQELVHVELAAAAALIDRASSLGVTRT